MFLVRRESGHLHRMPWIVGTQKYRRREREGNSACIGLYIENKHSPTLATADRKSDTQPYFRWSKHKKLRKQALLFHVLFCH